jgi:CRP/FNR family transcriptional regulator, anaerobic regulatory protein
MSSNATQEIRMLQATAQSETSSIGVARSQMRMPMQQWSTLQELLQLLDLPDEGFDAAHEAGFARRRISAGESLYRQGDPCAALHVVRLGTFKTGLVEEAGNEQVLGFWLRGDLLGADGLASGRHAGYAVALEDSEVISVNLDGLAHWGAAGERLLRELYRLTSREMVRQSMALLTIGTLAAEGRVARLLSTLAQRYGELGYSSSQFNLRMSRQEMASHLGLTLETVSRSLSALAARGTISVHNRTVVIRDPDALRRLRASCSSASQPRVSGVDAVRQAARRVGDRVQVVLQ